MELKEYISWIATFTSFCVQLVGIQICMKFIRRGTTSNVSCVPFTMNFVSACLWIRYSLLTQLPPILVINTTTLILQTCYITCYITYTLHKSFLYKQLLLGVSAVLVILTYVRYYVEDEGIAVMQLGLISCCMTVLTYSAPLATLADVVRTKCTETVSFPLVFANFLASVEWATYGALIKNRYIILPNSLGVLLTCLQLILFVRYPSSRPHSPVMQT